MIRLALVIPCHERYAITRIGFEQKAWLRNALFEKGIDLGVFAVIDTQNDDEMPNTAAAIEWGAYVVHDDNTVLGKRWNEGYVAAHRHAYQHVMPCGSDSWLHPSLFRRMPKSGEVIVTHRYSVVEPGGSWRADMWLPFVGLIFPLAMSAGMGYRPCEDHIARGCDTSTMRRLCDIGGGHLVGVDDPPLAYTAFHSRKQITDVKKLNRRARGVVSTDPFTPLRRMYPDALVDRIEGFYAQQKAKNHRTRAERRHRWLIPPS